MRKNKKLIVFSLLLLLIFFLGYIRETTFIVVNSVLHNYPFPFNASYITPPNFLYDLSQNALIIIKWGLTVFFSMLFMGATYLLMTKYFAEKKTVKYTLYIYIGLTFCSLISILTGYLLGLTDEMYPVARFFVGITHSPLLPLVIFAIFYFRSIK